MQGHAQRQTLPLHAAVESAVGAADDALGGQEQGRSDGVGERRHQRGPAAKARQGVLLDGQRMEAGAQAMRLLPPLVDAGELGRKMRLPKSDMTDPALDRRA